MMKLYGAPICADCREVKQKLDEQGRIGIPTFVWEDGSVTLDTGWLAAGSACTDC